MTTRLVRIRRWWRPADAPLAPTDPTRPRPVVVRDGVPIAHEGPPGFPGRSETADGDR